MRPWPAAQQLAVPDSWVLTTHTAQGLGQSGVGVGQVQGQDGWHWGKERPEGPWDAVCMPG